MLKKILFVLLCSVSFMLPANASTWVEISHKTYMDIDSIKTYIDDNDHTDNNITEIWIKSLNDGSNPFKEMEKLNNTKIWYMICKELINTKRNTTTIKTIILYNLKGEVIYSYTYPDYTCEWNSIIPDSKGEYWLQLINNPEILQKLYEEQQNK